MVRQSPLQDRIAAGILDVAAEVLAKQGIKTSMAEIARAAGVGRATLYRYFPNRDALLQGLVKTAIAELSTRIAEADLEKVPVREGIARLVRSFVTSGSKYAALAYGGTKEASDVKDLDRKILRPIRALIKRGVADGTLRDDIPAEVQFEIFGGLLEKALDLVLHKDLGLEQASSVITSLFLDGAARRPG